MSFKHNALRPAQILLPKESVSRETWACVACDQYTSQPEYWEKTDSLVKDLPSTLRLMLPECWLNESDRRVPVIHETMKRYLDEGLLIPAVEKGFILCERTIASGTRVGLVVTLDLEDYDYAKGSLPLVRPTEQTIASRLPARLAIRRGAPVELSHIMVLIDDPDRTVLEPLRARKNELKKLYDFDLMLNGGHLAGYAVEKEEDLEALDQAMTALREKLGDHPMLLAVGDGNHSLATAKAYWEEIKPTLSEEEKASHPARFALCEIENIHDEALLFEPIHRILTGVTVETLMKAWKAYAEARNMTLTDKGEGHSFTVYSGDLEQTVVVQGPEGAIPCETIQKFLDAFLADHPDVEIDYIHGDDTVKELSHRPDSVGFQLPPINKHSFFEDVRVLGVLPRKTFSMGEADEKRFYMESKVISGR